MNRELGMHEDKSLRPGAAAFGNTSEDPSEVEERIEIEYLDDGVGEPEGSTAASDDVDILDESVVGGEAPQDDALHALRLEHEQLREMYLRKLAEFDNFRKRTEREREELQKTAAEGLIRELLPVMDNLERALQHLETSDPDAFREGVEMIARQLRDLLQREGLEPVDPAGLPFEPEFHEAVHRVESTEHPPGTVVSVFAKGYTYRGRLLRPAMVSVAVESDAASPPSTGDSEDEGGAS
jgi:molecular chaperone GrpE